MTNVNGATRVERAEFLEIVEARPVGRREDDRVDPFGQTLAAQTDEIKPLDDKRFQIRLKKRFRQMTYALGATGCFVLPERMAKTPASEQVKEFIGSGPFVFKPDEWVSGARAAYEKFQGYVPRQEKPEYFSGGKVVYFDRVEWIVQPDPATAAASMQTGEVDWDNGRIAQIRDIEVKLVSTNIANAPKDLSADAH